MKRSEKVVKNIPADFTNPDRAERWLEENAEQGLMLIRYSGRKAVFIKGEPAKTAYMVVPMDPDGMKGPRDQGEEYKEFGWEYVTQLGRMVLILRGMPGKCERVQLLAGDTLFKKLRKKQRGRSMGAVFPIYFLADLVPLFLFFSRVWISPAFCKRSSLADFPGNGGWRAIADVELPGSTGGGWPSGRNSESVWPGEPFGRKS